MGRSAGGSIHSPQGGCMKDITSGRAGCSGGRSFATEHMSTDYFEQRIMARLCGWKQVPNALQYTRGPSMPAPSSREACPFVVIELDDPIPTVDAVRKPDLHCDANRSLSGGLAAADHVTDLVRVGGESREAPNAAALPAVGGWWARPSLLEHPLHVTALQL